jgi:hypothetical protein
MPWKTQDKQHFLDRADELRTMAEGCIIADNRRMLLNMAGYYEGFAREVEARIWERDHQAALVRNHTTAQKIFVNRSEAENVSEPDAHLSAAERENRLDFDGILIK